MTFSYMKHMMSALWIGVPIATGVAMQTTSLATWLTLTLVAVIPPAILTYLWRAPAASTSEEIQQALR